MTTETEQQPTWGEEPPRAAEGAGWSGRKALAAVAIAVGIAAAGGGVIYAAGNSEAARGDVGGPGGGLVVMGGPFGDAQHGEFQNGEVTGVGDSSVTVRSDDGFSETYRVDDDTRVDGGQGDVDDIAVGDVITVIASAGTDGEPVAESIARGDARRGGPRQRPGDDRPPADDEQGTPSTR